MAVPPRRGRAPADHRDGTWVRGDPCAAPARVRRTLRTGRLCSTGVRLPRMGRQRRTAAAGAQRPRPARRLAGSDRIRPHARRGGHRPTGCLGFVLRWGSCAVPRRPGSLDRGRDRPSPPYQRAGGRWEELQPENNVAARIALRVPFYSPGRTVEKITVPTLIQIAKRDTVTP